MSDEISLSIENGETVGGASKLLAGGRQTSAIFVVKENEHQEDDFLRQS